LIKSTPGVAFAVDSNIHLSEKKFEAEFHKIYLDPASEKKAAAALAKAEEQVKDPVDNKMNQMSIKYTKWP
jgi:hypothetical protein